ncbi:MAG TPA: hypothetical protein EYN28_01990 [Flavobacteriales bacterium]|nr:hypothetical protein [Flavobacteriales bacterium]HIB78071.1 hypothetical protein [Flavobacteriales bacterium]HIO58930.1 hypothetical protein [Flavobacteriales bacterium]
MDLKLKYPLPENVESHSIEITRTARWFHIGVLPSECQEIVILLHGYGQHPSYMLSGLHSLEKAGRSICAPEGLSRFYVRGANGRVGASWMTRDDRQQEIKDHISYLNTWLQSLKLSKNRHITLVGFSQGVATAARWIASGVEIDKVVFLSGTLPPEWKLKKPQISERIDEIHIVRPLHDEFYSETEHHQALDTLKSQDVVVKSHEPEGTHKINAQILNRILTAS